MILCLFFNRIPGIEDDYKKLSEDEKKDILIRQQGAIQDKYGTVILDDYHRPQSPEVSSNPISRAIYSWMDPILEIGYRRVLEDYDLYELVYTDRARTIMQTFTKYWERQINLPK